MTTDPTAPVPPDANGLRERVEALADVLTQHGHPGEVLTVFGEAWIKCGCGAKIDLPVRDDKVSAADVARLFAEHQARALAASEAAPTAGEGPDNCGCGHRECPGLVTGSCPLPATPPADNANEGKYAIEDGWLVQVVNKHTCGTGPDGYYGAHEPGCGMVPVADISDLLAARESAAAARGLTVCDQEHGHEGNPARVYGHFGSNRTCIRLRATDEWVYDPAWEMTA